MKKRLLSLVLVLATVLSLLCANVSAASIVASGSCGDSARWSLDSEGTLTISGSGRMTDYARNGAPWFSNRTSITSVTVGGSITHIGNYAFASCTAITSVTLGSGVLSIGDSAFLLCTKLKEISLPDKLTTIGYGAFWSSGLTAISIPASVTEIGDRAFFNSNIATLTVDTGNTAYSASSNVLFNKDKSTLIYYPKGLTKTSYSISTVVERIAPYAFYDNESLRTLTITSPAYSQLTEIGEYAFAYCSYLSSVTTLPTSLRSVGAHAFNYTGLTTAKYYGTSSLWSSCVSVGDRNTALTNVLTYGTETHPDHPVCGFICTCTDTHHAPITTWYSWNGTSSISSTCYYLSADVTRESYYGITGSVTLCLNDHTITTNGEAEGMWVTSTGSLRVTDCGTEGTIVSNDGTNISSSAECGITNLGKVHLYNGTLSGETGIKNYEGATCNIYGGTVSGTQIGIWNEGTANVYGGTISGEDDSIWSVGTNSVCLIEGAVLTGSLSNYGTMTINGGTLTCDRNQAFTAIYNGGTMTIEDMTVAFTDSGYCTTITNDGELHINGGTFPSGSNGGALCYSLHNRDSASRAYLSGTPELSALCVDYPKTLYFVSSDGSSAYTAQNELLFRVNPTNFPNSGVAASNVTDAIAGKITQVNVYGEASDEDGCLEHVGTDLIFAKIVASGKCGDTLYWSLDGNGRLIISGTGDMYDFTSTSMPWYSYRSQIKKVTIETGCTYIGDQAFASCSAMTEIVFGESQMSMGDYVFEFCDGLESVTIPANVQLGYAAFHWCEGLKSVTVGCSDIPKYAFELCLALEEVTLQEGVKTVATGAFRRTDALTEITFPASTVSVDEYAFANNNLGATQLTDITFLSPDTSIHAGALTYMPLDQITVHGDECSTAERFARAKGMAFEALANGRRHTVGQAVRENEVDAACTEPASYESVVYCSVCGAEISRTTVVEEGSQTGHNFTQWEIVTQPSYTQEGEQIRTCTNDNCTQEEREVIPATGPALVGAVDDTYDVQTGTVTLTNVPEGLTVVLACYESDQMTAVDICFDAAETTAFTLPEGHETCMIRVFFLAEDGCPVGPALDVSVQEA